MKINKVILVLFALSFCFIAASCSSNPTNESNNELITTTQTVDSNNSTEDEFTLTQAKLDKEYDELFSDKKLSKLSNYELSEEIFKISDKWNKLSSKYIKLFKEEFNDQLVALNAMHYNRDTSAYLETYNEYISKLDEKNKTELEMYKSIYDVVTGGASASVAVAKYDYSLSREKAIDIYNVYNLLKN